MWPFSDFTTPWQLDGVRYGMFQKTNIEIAESSQKLICNHSYNLPLQHLQELLNTSGCICFRECGVHNRQSGIARLLLVGYMSNPACQSLATDCAYSLTIQVPRTPPNPTGLPVPAIDFHVTNASRPAVEVSSNRNKCLMLSLAGVAIYLSLYGNEPSPALNRHVACDSCPFACEFVQRSNSPNCSSTRTGEYGVDSATSQ